MVRARVIKRKRGKENREKEKEREREAEEKALTNIEIIRFTYARKLSDASVNIYLSKRSH